MRDPDFGPVRVRAFGTYSLRAVDPKTLLTELVGTDSLYEADEISEWLRSIINSAFADVVASSGIAVLDLSTRYERALGPAPARGAEPHRRRVRARAPHAQHREHLPARRGRARPRPALEHGRPGGPPGLPRLPDGERDPRRGGESRRRNRGSRHGLGNGDGDGGSHAPGRWLPTRSRSPRRPRRLRQPRRGTWPRAASPWAPCRCSSSQKLRPAAACGPTPWCGAREWRSGAWRGAFPSSPASSGALPPPIP